MPISTGSSTPTTSRPTRTRCCPRVSATLPASTGFSDELAQGYSFAVYTTADPALQVRMGDVDPTVASGSTLALTADVVDGPAGVTWSVEGTGNGSVSTTGVYTPPTVDSERKIAVRATSTADPTSSGSPWSPSSRSSPRVGSTPCSSTSTAACTRVPTCSPSRRRPRGADPLHHRRLGSHGELDAVRAAGDPRRELHEALPGRRLRLGQAALGHHQPSLQGRRRLRRTRRYTLCANEGGTCFFSGQQSVAFGGDGLFTYQAKTGPVACDTATLGDPNPSGTPRCYVSPSCRRRTRWSP